MWGTILINAAFVLSVYSIKVPIDNDVAENQTELIPINISDQPQNNPIYYNQDQEKVDDYLLPPHAYKLEEIKIDVPEPLTYLVPPAPGQQSDFYYKPVEPEQTDWYPIPANPQLSVFDSVGLQQDKPEEIAENNNYRTRKVIEKPQQILLPPRNLVPPAVNAQNDFIIFSPSPDLELPLENIDFPTNEKFVNNGKHLVKPYPINHKNVYPLPYPVRPLNIPPKPTKRFPKKYPSNFKPIPIPINQFASELSDKVPMARPVGPFNPMLNREKFTKPLKEDKNIYRHEKAENKRKLQKGGKGVQDVSNLSSESEDTPQQDRPREQETSETNFRHPERNIYPAPLKKAPPMVTHKPIHESSNGDRTEFRMHGMKGPHSYQFGYDTGKGKNRQFRYEERDNDGHVRGHYGYVDKFGKLRVVNYDADPEHGFRAESPVEKESK